MLQILDTGISQAEENMKKDQLLLEKLDPKGDPILHLYSWDGPSATFGFFIQPEKHISFEGASKHNLKVARRPTGGGIVFHIWDLAFSFLMPSGHPFFSLSTLENYRFVNEAVLDAMRLFFSFKQPVELIASSFPSLEADCQNFCMARPTQYDVVYEGKKIAGAAQRRRKQGYLHQGTISLAFPKRDLLEDVLLVKKEVLDAISFYTFAPLGFDPSPDDLTQARLQIQKELGLKLMEKLSMAEYAHFHGKTENCNHTHSR